MLRQPEDFAGNASAVELCCTASNTVPHLLVVDPDPTGILAKLRESVWAFNYRVELARTGERAMDCILKTRPDIVLLEPRLPDQSGLELHELIRSIDANIPVIFVSQGTTSKAAIEAMRQGAYDYLSKPIDSGALQRVVERAMDIAQRTRISSLPPDTLADNESEDTMLGASPAMFEVYKSIGHVAGQNVSVLITGETGTGKELVARAIHQHSSRADRPFLALNCAAIPENLLESELFGHEKGAFSGADRRRIGKFEQCDGGTILLDEIGDMPVNLQAKMLRLLQEQSFERVGGNETIRTNVRIIASTHRNLGALSATDKFRSDLYYRLSVFTIHLPPLRERSEDLPILVRYFARKYGREMGRNIQEIAPELIDRLQDYSWPGNIRELQSIIRQTLLCASGRILLESFLPDRFGSKGKTTLAGPTPPAEGLAKYIVKQLACDSQDLYAKTHGEVDRLLLTQVCEYAGGNQRKAARLLGIARQTLRTKLRELGLAVSHFVEEVEDHQETLVLASHL